jgi:hypothetical protein
MKRLTKFSYIVLCALLPFAILCTAEKVASPPTLSGGATGTEISACTVSGKVVDSLDKPVAGCVVKLRPQDFLSGIDAVLPGRAQDNVTNDEGRYSFDGIQPGLYYLEVAYSDSFGRSVEVAVDSAESLKVLVPTVIEPLATIFGNNLPVTPSTGSASLSPSVRAIGFDRTALIDSTGHFEMKVPPGWCRLHLEGVDPNFYQGNTVVYAKSGTFYNVTPPQYFFTPCDSLPCEKAFIQELLDSNGLFALTPESVTVVEAGRITELHVRGRGLHVLPPSICWLLRLRVLDVGKNFLPDLPVGIGNLRKLTILRADSNWLWYLPPSIGMLFSLRELTISTNFLQSLPGPITALKPTILDLNFNMLCNMGNSTEVWADQFAFGWKERQYCSFNPKPPPPFGF